MSEHSVKMPKHSSAGSPKRRMLCLLSAAEASQKQPEQPRTTRSDYVSARNSDVARVLSGSGCDWDLGRASHRSSDLAAWGRRKNSMLERCPTFEDSSAGSSKRKIRCFLQPKPARPGATRSQPAAATWPGCLQALDAIGISGEPHAAASIWPPGVAERTPC
jgi:hypothetical protein